MTKPSWQDFGTHDESIVPELWDGVIGAWAPCLGPTGSRLHDMSRRANWGQSVNVTPENLWTIDEGQYCAQLSRALSQSVAVTNFRHPNGKFALTCSLWIKWTALDTFFPLAFTMGTDAGGGNQGYLMWRESGSSKVRAEFGSSTGAAIAASTTPNNVWTHVVGTYNTTVNSIFLNGKLEGTVNYTAANITGSALSIGGLSLEIFHTNCRIAEVVIWQKSLTPNEISSLYQLGRGGMYQRRRRRAIYLPQAGFQPAWALRRSQIIGGGLR